MYKIKSHAQVCFNRLIASADKWNVHNIANAAWKWEKLIWGLNAPDPDEQEKASLATWKWFSEALLNFGFSSFLIHGVSCRATSSTFVICTHTFHI